jgi:hypothetical protein
VNWLAQRGRWLSYSIDMAITEEIHRAVLPVHAFAWTATLEADGRIRDEAWVAGLADDVLRDWAAGMRLIVHKERPHPGPRCGSPTPTTCGSPASPPAPAIFRSLPWSCGTANAPGPRTASAPPATAACAICR